MLMERQIRGVTNVATTPVPSVWNVPYAHSAIFWWVSHLHLRKQHGWGQEMKYSQYASLLVALKLRKHFLALPLALALIDLCVIGWKHCHFRRMRRSRFLWFPVLWVEGPKGGRAHRGKKWRVWSPRTGVEWQRRPHSRTVRVGARSDGAHSTPVPENWLVCTRQVSRSAPFVGLVLPAWELKKRVWYITTGCRVSHQQTNSGENLTNCCASDNRNAFDDRNQSAAAPASVFCPSHNAFVTQ